MINNVFKLGSRKVTVLGLQETGINALRCCPSMPIFELLIYFFKIKIKKLLNFWLNMRLLFYFFAAHYLNIHNKLWLLDVKDKAESSSVGGMTGPVMRGLLAYTIFITSINFVHLINNVTCCGYTSDQLMLQNSRKILQKVIYQ